MCFAGIAAGSLSGASAAQKATLGQHEGMAKGAKIFVSDMSAGAVRKTHPLWFDHLSFARLDVIWDVSFARLHDVWEMSFASLDNILRSVFWRSYDVHDLSVEGLDDIQHMTSESRLVHVMISEAWHQSNVSCTWHHPTHDLRAACNVFTFPDTEHMNSCASPL